MVDKKKYTRKRKDHQMENVPEIEKEWIPTTELGKLVKEGAIKDIDEVFNNNHKIMEVEIVKNLIPDLEEDLLLIGQAKGKFGGGQRRIFRQTQKKTREGNRIQFVTCAVVGNKNGYVGVATGKSKETVPARDKAKRKARLNIIRIRRGCGSWESDSKEPNSIPFAVTGKCGSIRLTLLPAPKGTGLCIEKECAKILTLAGINDVWSKTEGQTKTKLNLITALLDALKKLSERKIQAGDIAKLGIVEGKLKVNKEDLEKQIVVKEIPVPEEIQAETVADGAETGTEEAVVVDTIDAEKTEAKVEE